MGDLRLRFFKYILPRFTFQITQRNKFCRIHNLPQKVISQQIILDIKKSETLWRWNKANSNLSKHLHDCFMQNEEVLTYALDMISCISNRSSGSSELVFSVVKTFDDYIRQHKIEIFPTLVQKNDALFSVLHYNNYQLIKLVCNVFKLTEQAHTFKNIIEEMILQQKIIDAAYCVSALHLQKEFEVEKILLPLLLEGQTQCARIYMSNHPDLQLKVAKLLDDYLNNDFSNPYINSKKVYQTLTTLVNIFKISLVHCPNLHFIRSKGAINILVKKRIQQSVTEAAWEDMIKTVIGENDYLKRFLIKKLVLKNDKKTALEMAEKFNINDPDLLLSLSKDDIVENQDDLDDVKPEDLEMPCNPDKFESEDNSINHLEFAFKADDIMIIANQEDFLKCIDEISQNYTMIGIDSEWKPHFGLSRERLSLIQLAGHDKVFIFDVLLLSECLEAQHWDMLFDKIFGNPNIIKLGCGIMGDVNMILESIKGSIGKTIKFSHMLDMALFYQKLQDVYPEKLEQQGDNSSTKGLSSLCDIILGKPLNKEERLCDWEQRPLKESQLEYAALDAHCLLQMYDKLREDSLKQNINFDHLSKVAIVLTNSQWKPKRRFKGVKSDKAFHIHSALPIDHFKVVMDPVFESQGKELRQLGADVVILKDDDTAESAIELSNSEGRVIICSEDLWNQVKDKVKEGFCHQFSTASDESFKASRFLQYFNVQVKVKSIFTRCTICNSNDGVKLYLEDIKKLYELEETSTDSMNSSIKNNLSVFSPELKAFLADILNSSINIKFASTTQTASFNECAFLCKTCGNIC